MIRKAQFDASELVQVEPTPNPVILKSGSCIMEAGRTRKRASDGAIEVECILPDQIIWVGSHCLYRCVPYFEQS